MSILFAPIYIFLIALPVFLFVGAAMLALELATFVREGKKNGKI